MASKKTRITLSYTPKEWSAIDDRLNQIKRATIKSYLRGEISKLAKEYVSSQKKICAEIQKREKRKEYISEEDLKILEIMSIKTGIPKAEIVNQLIIFPLLLNSKD